MKRKSLRTKVQTGLLPGFDNWDLFVPAGGFLLTAFLLQKITGSAIIQLLVPAASAVGSFMLRIWLKDNFPAKHLVHWFNWLMSSDILLPSPDADPVPLVIAMPNQAGRLNRSLDKGGQRVRI